ncbi:MAG: DUF4185 domain-containing protein [Myxococcota bacterium]
MGWRCVLLVVVSLVAMGGCPACQPVDAQAWPEADALFHTDPRWIGGDGAMTVDLGDDRILWLFGDSFIANTPERVRARSHMVRNSVALQTGRNPAQAFMRFAWAGDALEPRSWFPEEGAEWFWPGQGVRLGDRVLLFYLRIKQVGEGMWGFASAGWTATLAGPVDADLNQWTFQPVALPASSFGVNWGHAVLDEPDGHLYVYGERGREHAILLVRFRRDDAERGDLSKPEWWCGPRGWGGDCEPEELFSPGAPELSVQRDSRAGGFVMVHTVGFGASTLAIRTAPTPQGPWSATRDVYTPQESAEQDTLVYAGKGHPGLTGADVVATYVAGRLGTIPVEEEHRLYWPRFVRINWEGVP